MQLTDGGLRNQGLNEAGMKDSVFVPIVNGYSSEELLMEALDQQLGELEKQQVCWLVKFAKEQNYTWHFWMPLNVYIHWHDTKINKFSLGQNSFLHVYSGTEII